MNSNQSPEFSAIATLSGSRPTRKVQAGEVVYNTGDLGDVLFGVVSGTIDVSWGDDQTESFGPGSCFGVAALVDADHRRFGTAIARTDAELLEMDRLEFLFAMQELPLFGLEMLHDMEMRLQALKLRGL